MNQLLSDIKLSSSMVRKKFLRSHLGQCSETEILNVVTFCWRGCFQQKKKKKWGMFVATVSAREYFKLLRI